MLKDSDMELIKRVLSDHSLDEAGYEDLRTARFGREWVKNNLRLAVWAVRVVWQISKTFVGEEHKRVTKAFIITDSEAREKLSKLDDEKREIILDLLARALFVEAMTGNKLRPDINSVVQSN